MKRLLSIIVAVGVLLTTLTLGVTAASKDAYSIVKRDGKWICVDKKGKFNKTANGIYQNSNGWWKTSNGVVTFKETGVFQNDYGWWRVANSKVDFKANGIYQNQNGWWKTTNGKVTFKENGVYQNENGWWRVANSKVDFKANGIYQNQNGWWKTTNGKVTFKENGIFKNENGNWYVKDSKVDFKKNGKVSFNGNSYQVTNGKAEPIGLETAIVSFDANGTSVTNMPEAIKVTVNELIIEPPAPKKDGYYFVGWYNDKAGTERFNFSQPIQSNLILYAKWITESDNLNDDIIDRGDIEILSDDGVIEVIYNQDGSVLTVDGKLSNKTISSKEDASDVLNSAKSLFGDDFKSTAEEIDVQTIDNNTNSEESFYRYIPSKNGIPVLGGQIIISTDRNGSITGLYNSYDSRIDEIDTTPDLSSQDAEQIAIDVFLNEDSTKDYIKQADNTSSIKSDELIQSIKSLIKTESNLLVYAPNNTMKPVLVFAVKLTCEHSYIEEGEEYQDDYQMLVVDKTYYITANEDTGSLVCTIDNNPTLTVDAKDLRNNTRKIGVEEKGNNYILRDPVRNIETYDVHTNGDFFLPGSIVKASKNNFSANVSKDAVSAHANMSAAYDYYHDVLNRLSYDDKGSTVIVSTNYCKNWANAQWKPSIQQFQIGSKRHFSACLDIIGHEFTHAVISSVADLYHNGEPGALNEAYADIMGSFIEGKSDNKRWLVAEDSDWGAIRSIANPSAWNDSTRTFPDHYDNYIRYVNQNRVLVDGDVHDNSTIFSHAAYKMMTDSRTADISNDTWANVFYKSIFRLSSTASFLKARGAVIAAAKMESFNHDQIQAIKDSFDAVGIIEHNTIRIVLTWGETPSDLDSHLVYKDTYGDLDSKHLSYQNKDIYEDDSNSILLADLDYDDQTSYGPEVITIHPIIHLIPGEYFYYVHDYSNRNSSDSDELARSNAVVKVYTRNNATPIKTFSVDNNSKGTYWDVFKITVFADDITITPINNYGSSSSIN